MNYAMVRQLVLKDWHFHRWGAMGLLVAGLVSLSIMTVQGMWWFTAGSVLLMTALLTYSSMLVINNVSAETTNRTRSFLLSLPISMREYTVAKIIANLSILLVPWLALLGSSYIVITLRPNLPDGLFAFAVLILTEVVVGYCLLFAIAIITESQSWATAGIVVTNLLFQASLFYTANLEPVKRAMQSPQLTWDPAFTNLLLLEILAIVVILAFTVFVQFRKTNLV